MSNRYLPIAELQNPKGKRYYSNVVFPDIPLSDSDIYVITTIGDRLDLLASSYYKDISLYWIIQIANKLPGDSIYPPLGIQLRIPVDIGNILTNYAELNQTR